MTAVHAGQHSFIIGAGRVPEVDQAIAEMGGWLRSRLGLLVLQYTAKWSMRRRSHVRLVQ